MAFKYVGIKRTWWILFQKRLLRTKFDIYVSIFWRVFSCCHEWYAWSKKKLPFEITWLFNHKTFELSKSLYSYNKTIRIMYHMSQFWSTSTNIVLRCFIAVRYSLLLSNILLSDPSLFILFFTAAVVSIWIMIVLTLSSAWK